MPKPDRQRRPEKASGAALVFLGSFNPAIFQPAWLMRHDLVPDEEDAAEIEAITPQVTAFSIDWLRLFVQPERLEMQATSEAPSYKALLDLALGIFDLLPHVPVTGFGINRFAHFEVESVAAFDAIGYGFFSRDVWNGVLEDPRMRTVQVEDRHGKNEEPERITTVTVQPSTLGPRTVFVGTNDHFPFSPDTTASRKAVEKLVEYFDLVLREAEEIIDHVWTL